MLPSTAFAARSQTVTRPADTTAYASGDLIANSTTAASVTPFAIECVNAQTGIARIDRMRVQKSGSSVTNCLVRVHLYKATVVPVNGDNAAFSTSIASYIGALDVTVDRAFSDGAEGAGVPLVGSAIVLSTLDAGAATNTVYALLEARGAYTPASGETWTLIAEGYRF